MTTTQSPATGTTAVDRFLEAICDGAGVSAELFAPEMLLDATVPDWRFSAKGPEAVARQYSCWFNAPGTLEELERWPVEGGEVVVYLVTSAESGVPYAAHHCHVLDFDAEGRIARDRFFCGGRWEAARLAEMAAAEQAG
jgi:hypothetical protein